MIRDPSDRRTGPKERGNRRPRAGSDPFGKLEVVLRMSNGNGGDGPETPPERR